MKPATVYHTLEVSESDNRGLHLKEHLGPVHIGDQRFTTLDLHRAHRKQLFSLCPVHTATQPESAVW